MYVCNLSPPRHFNQFLWLMAENEPLIDASDMKKSLKKNCPFFKKNQVLVLLTSMK